MKSTMNKLDISIMNRMLGDKKSLSEVSKALKIDCKTLERFLPKKPAPKAPPVK